MIDYAAKLKLTCLGKYKKRTVTNKIEKHATSLEINFEIHGETILSNLKKIKLKI